MYIYFKKRKPLQEKKLVANLFYPIDENNLKTEFVICEKKTFIINHSISNVLKYRIVTKIDICTKLLQNLIFVYVFITFLLFFFLNRNRSKYLKFNKGQFL